MVSKLYEPLAYFASSPELAISTAADTDDTSLSLKSGCFLPLGRPNGHSKDLHRLQDYHIFIMTNLAIQMQVLKMTPNRFFSCLRLSNSKNGKHS